MSANIISGKRDQTLTILQSERDSIFLFFMHFFSGTKHPREDDPNLYYSAEMTGLHTQTCNI